MTRCPLCDKPVPNRHTRGPLMTQLDPPGAWWKGMPLRIAGYPLAIMHALARTGELSSLALQMVGAGEEAGASSVKVRLSVLRRALPRGLSIVTIHGWGIRLSIVEHPEEPA